MIDKDQIIKIAACHTCGAYRGQPCTFARCEDPSGLRTAARQSHVARIKLARTRYEKMLAPISIKL